ncbi:hypothetical protein MR626_13240 [bacterium]|nr:hypothetical protein [bacterium]
MVEIKNFPNNQDVYRGAEAVMRWLYGRTSGVFGAAGNAAVSAFGTSRMAVQVSDGTGWLADENGIGCVWWIDVNASTGAMLNLGVEAADAVYSRIDRVIVEWNTPNYTDVPVVRILSGSLANTPVPPPLTNNRTTRQISLARIYIEAGATEITDADITDERLDKTVCGIVTDRVNIDTSVMQAQFSALLTYIQDELSALESGTAVELKKLLFTGVSVAASAFVSDSTYEDYGYRASVALSGVTSSMIPEVVFSPADVSGGNFAPVAETYNGGIYLYAADVPESQITIPTIICWRGA